MMERQVCQAGPRPEYLGTFVKVIWLEKREDLLKLWGFLGFHPRCLAVLLILVAVKLFQIKQRGLAWFENRNMQNRNADSSITLGGVFIKQAPELAFIELLTF